MVQRYFSLWLVISALITGMAHAQGLGALDDEGVLDMEFSGEVVEVQVDTIKVKPDGAWRPQVGDPVRIVVGSGTVQAVTDEGIVVKIDQGGAGMNMIANITSSGIQAGEKPKPAEPPPVVAKKDPVPPPTKKKAGPPENWQALSADQLYDWGAKYYQGKNVDQSYEQAMLWFKRAADKGHVGALNDIGVMHELGQGVKKDFDQAVAYYRKGEAQNYPLAHYNIGRAYEVGQGVPKDYSEALKSYRRAARLGEKNAQAKLRERRLRW